MSGGHVFISYARVDAGEVDKMEEALAVAGIPVWRDTARLWPGDNWRLKIRQAIGEDALVVIACFSERSLGRTAAYQNEELTLAIEQLRLRRPDMPWLIPVRFDDCKMPDLDIGGGHTLSSLQRADLFGAQIAMESARLVEAVRRILDHGQPACAGDSGRAHERKLTDGRTGRADGAEPASPGAMPLEADGRWAGISGGIGPGGPMKPMSFEVLAGLASGWAALLPEPMINDGPAKLLGTSRSQFTYSWFNYDFMATACLTGLQALEAAFRVLYPEAERTAFRALIDRARREGILPDNIAELACSAEELHALLSHPLTQAPLTPEEAVPMLENCHRLVALVMHAASARDAAWRAHHATSPGQPEAAGLTGGLLERARAVHPMLGQRQAQVLLELAKAGPAGASCGRIANAISYDEPNCHITLNSLVGKSLVDKDTSTHPHTYRLTPPFLDGDVSAQGARAAARPANWRLIADAATALTAAGQTPFTRQAVYEWIWKRYTRAEHDRPSLDPTFQGMVKNATGGPPSAGGQPLIRLDRGQYTLADDGK